MINFVLSQINGQVWNPPYGLLWFILLIGALMTAGVGLMVFNLYVDDYWADEEFRKELRFGNRKLKRVK